MSNWILFSIYLIFPISLNGKAIEKSSQVNLTIFFKTLILPLMGDGMELIVYVYSKYKGDDDSIS